AHAVKTTAAAEDGGVDADDATLRIDERAARIAGINRRVGLNEVFVSFDAETAATEAADDALRNGHADAEGIADGENRVAHFELIAVTQRGDGQVFRIDLEHGDVGLGIATDDPGFELLTRFAKCDQH